MGRQSATGPQMSAVVNSSRADTPKISEIKIAGGPYHTSPLRVVAQFINGQEGNSIIQWYRSVGDWWFAPIPGATGKEYQPVADDLHCQIRVEYTPVRVDGVRGASVIGHVPSHFLMIDPMVAQTVEQNVLDGAGIWDVQFNNETRTIVCNKEKIKIRKNDKTLKKENYGDFVQVILHPTNLRIFTLVLNRKDKFDFVCDTHIVRDIIMLTINSFVTMVRNARSGAASKLNPLASKNKKQNEFQTKTVPLAELRKKEASTQSPIDKDPDAPKITDLVVEGGPFHTSPLKVHAKYSGGKEGTSIVYIFSSSFPFFLIPTSFLFCYLKYFCFGRFNGFDRNRTGFSQ